MAAQGRAIYVFGGRSVEHSAEMFDLETMHWTTLRDIPASHDYFAQAVPMADGSVYVFGSTVGAISKYEPLTKNEGTWKSLPGTGMDAKGGGVYSASLSPLVLATPSRG